MTQRKKNVLIAIAMFIGFGIVGAMDEQDAQCSWNGCGDERFTQE